MGIEMSTLLDKDDRVLLANYLNKNRYRRENQPANYASILLMSDALDGIEEVLQKKGLSIRLKLMVDRTGGYKGPTVVRGITITVGDIEQFVKVTINRRQVRVGARLYKFEHTTFDETLLRAIEFEIALTVGSQH
jgi:hypothetical protein